jgi:hypothetical protein
MLATGEVRALCVGTKGLGGCVWGELVRWSGESGDTCRLYKLG